MASHALSSQQPQNHKALAQEPEPSKEKQHACSPSSSSLKYSSHSITSHSIPQKLEAGNITFNDMHPEASTNENKNLLMETCRHTWWHHLKAMGRGGQPPTKNITFKFIL
jgi:hypothetical protein